MLRKHLLKGRTAARATLPPSAPAKEFLCFFFFSFGDNIHMRKHPQASLFKVKTSLNSNWGWKPSP